MFEIRAPIQVFVASFHAMVASPMTITNSTMVFWAYQMARFDVMGWFQTDHAVKMAAMVVTSPNLTSATMHDSKNQFNGSAARQRTLTAATTRMKTAPASHLPRRISLK